MEPAHERCQHAQVTAGCVACTYIESIRISKAATQKHSEFEAATAGAYRACQEDPGKRAQYEQLSALKGVWDGYAVAMQERVTKQKPEYDRLKEESKTDPRIWDKAVEAHQLDIEYEFAKNERTHYEFIPAQSTTVQQHELGAVDRSAVEAQLDYILTFPRATRFVTKTAMRDGLDWDVSKALGGSGNPATMSVGATWDGSALGIPDLGKDAATLKDVQKLGGSKDSILHDMDLLTLGDSQKSGKSKQSVLREMDLLRRMSKTYGDDSTKDNAYLIQILKRYADFIHLLVAYYGSRTSSIALQEEQDESESAPNAWDDYAKSMLPEDLKKKKKSPVPREESGFDRRTCTAHGLAQWIEDCEKHYGGETTFRDVLKRWLVDEKRRNDNINKSVDKQYRWRDEDQQAGRSSHPDFGGEYYISPAHFTDYTAAPLMSEDK